MATAGSADAKKRAAPTETSLEKNFNGWNADYTFFTFVHSSERLDGAPAIECQLCKVRYFLGDTYTP